MRLAHERVRAEVPATSANLGPGFDALGLALELRDVYELELTTSNVEVEILGEGAEDLPRDERHLVVRALRAALDRVGAPQAGFHLTCTNQIPHGRGLGSSAAAIVGGIALARGLLENPDVLTDHLMLQLATEFEGHPDNAAPAILGGVTTSYTVGEDAFAHTLTLRPDQDGASVLDPVIISPTTPLATEKARALLPAELPFADAAFNVSRSALLVHALAAGDRDLLLRATEDRMHQDRRESGMPASVSLMHSLRAEGLPAVISGAGPTVLIPAGAPAEIARLVRDMVDDPAQWQIARVPLAEHGVRTVLP